jgi:hypothetical protein
MALSSYKDPAPGERKALTVQFMSGGATQTLTANDGGMLSLPNINATAAVIPVNQQPEVQYVPVPVVSGSSLEQGPYNQKRNVVHGTPIYYYHQ